MSQAAYDRTFDVLAGPGDPLPFHYKFTVQGRLVPQLQVRDLTNNFMDWPYWITYSGPLASAGPFAFNGTTYSQNLRRADVFVDLATGDGYTVIVAQEVSPPFRSSYRRVLVLDVVF